MPMCDVLLRHFLKNAVVCACTDTRLRTLISYVLLTVVSQVCSR